MFSGVNILCFTVCYAVAFLLAISRLLFRSSLRRIAMLGFAEAGLIAHTVFLCRRAMILDAAPWSSQKDWFLMAAWVLAAAYLYFAVRRPQAPFGLFLLPLTLALIGIGTLAADSRPLATQVAFQLWGMIHGLAILTATVSVLIAFVAGLMYLGQTRHLKHKILPTRGPRLPSLEWLQWVNSRAVLVAAPALGVGLLAGEILDRINAQNGVPPLGWRDPVVVSTWFLFFWLVIVLAMSVFHRHARQGQKVAYLTIAGLVFLAIMLGAALAAGDGHWGRLRQPPPTAFPPASLPNPPSSSFHADRRL